MKRLIALAALAFTSADPAMARDCTNAPTQMEVNICAQDAFGKADTKLNDAYRRAKARVTGDALQSGLLTKAQRAWISFRDAECEFQGAAVEGGSMQPAVVAACLEDLSEKRRAQLTAYPE